MIEDVERQVENSGVNKPVLLGGMAQTMSIELHIATVNSQYGTQGLQWKLDRYRPDFYIALGTESKIRDQISQMYHLELLSTYDVLGNYYAGKPVYFYRLIPLTAGSGTQ